MSDPVHMAAKREQWNTKQQKRAKYRRPSEDPAVRRRGLAMLAEGQLVTDVAGMLRVSPKTLRKWHEEANAPKKEKNITPAPYALGYRWANTKW